MDEVAVLSIRKIDTEVSVVQVTDGYEAHITASKAHSIAVVLIVNHWGTRSSIGKLIEKS